MSADASDRSDESPGNADRSRERVDASDAPDALDAPDDHPVLLFDGVCNLCNGTIQFVIDADPEGRFRFAPLQSAVGRELLDRCGLAPDDTESVVLVDGDDYYMKSDAAIEVGERLGLPYSLLAAGRIVPRTIRDALYDFVAERRYRWFGRREECMVPSPDVASRFLERSR